MQSSPHSYLGGFLHFYLIDGVTINISTAKRISDADWLAYLEGTYEVGQSTGMLAASSIVHFDGATPSSTQRRTTADFVARRNLPNVNIAYLSDNDIMSGAFTAFSWLVPSMQGKAFKPSDLPAAIAWLQRSHRFDGEAVRRAIAHSWGVLRAASASV